MTTRTTQLTARQQQVFELIQRTINRTGFPPTRAEIAAELGFSSVNSAEEHLRALARKGVVELATGSSRGIRLLNEAARSDDFQHQLTTAASEHYAVVAAADRARSCGCPILAQEHISQHLRVRSGAVLQQADYLLKVRGLSMRDAGILDGDLLAVQKRTETKDGQIVVARLGDNVTVKRWKRHLDGVELIAENPDYDNIFVRSGSTECALEGIAVGLIRSGEF